MKPRQLFHLMFLSAGLLFGCDESLPPRNDPPEILVTSFRMDDGIVHIRDSLPLGTEGAFEAFVTNVYQEVLQDSEHVSISIDLSLKGQPERKTRILGDRFDVFRQSMFQGKLLTIGTDSAVHIVKQWTQRTDDGIWYWAFAGLTQEYTRSGVPFWQSDTLTFVVEATIQAFKNVQPRKLGPLEYRIAYTIF